MGYAILKAAIDDFYEPKDDQNNFLDLGCRQGESMFRMIKDFSWITQLTGVDDDRGNFLEEYYSGGIQMFAEKFKEFEPWKNLGLNKLNKVAIEPISIEEYAEKSKTKFDFVVLSNVLHFYKRSKQRLKLLADLEKLLNDEGMIYIKTANTKHVHYNGESEKAVGLSYKSICDEVKEVGYQFKMNPIEFEEEHWCFIIQK